MQLNWRSTDFDIRVLQVFTNSPVPNGEQPVEGMESDGGSADMDYADDSEDDSEGSDGSEEVESPPRTERRSKANQDRSIGQSKVPASSGRNPKRTRTTTPVPDEKTAKQLKTAAPKPRKALPRNKVTAPIAST